MPPPTGAGDEARVAADSAGAAQEAGADLDRAARVAVDSANGPMHPLLRALDSPWLLLLLRPSKLRSPRKDFRMRPSPRPRMASKPWPRPPTQPLAGFRI